MEVSTLLEDKDQVSGWLLLDRWILQQLSDRAVQVAQDLLEHRTASALLTHFKGVGHSLVESLAQASEVDILVHDPTSHNLHNRSEPFELEFHQLRDECDEL